MPNIRFDNDLSISFSYKYYICKNYFKYMIFIDSKDKILLFIGGIIITIIVLVPASLVEFRYFTLPLLFLNFEIKPSSNEKKEKKLSFVNRIFDDLTINMIIYSTINLAIFSAFIFRPFNCEDGKICRFMW